MADYGDLDFDSRWEESPMEKYIEYKRNRDRITEGRIREIEYVIHKSSDRIDHPSWNDYLDWRDEITVEDAWDFLSQLRSAGLSERTVKERMMIVQSFLGHLHKRNVIDGNPVALVCDEADFEYSATEKIEATVDEIARYLSSVPDPQERAAGVLMAKTGMRKGEVLNIDLMDLNLDYQKYHAYLDNRGIDFHQAIEDRPDSLFVSSEPTTGERYRGEVRETGNKRKRDTIIPLDKETKHALLDWLAMRPQTEYPHNLLAGRTSNKRMGVKALNRHLTGQYAKQAGIIDDGSDGRFSPHWFRHMFTTQLKPGRGDHPRYLELSMIKYLRGDVEDDIMEVYTHEWGDTLRPAYEEAIYQFDLYD